MNVWARPARRVLKGLGLMTITSRKLLTLVAKPLVILVLLQELQKGLRDSQFQSRIKQIAFLQNGKIDYFFRSS